MPSDLFKTTTFAVIAIVLLRISVGWHLFYEGMWKLNTQNTATPWTAEGYLKNATGPLRNHFRGMSGDPNDYKWLDYDAMSAKWDRWRDRFAAHYNIEKKALDRLLDGPESGFAVPLDSIPEGLNFDELIKSAGVAKDAIRYDAAGKKLVVDGKLHLLMSEQAKLIEAVKESSVYQADQAGCDKFIQAIKDVGSRSSKLAYRERLAAVLKGDPERVGVVLKSKKESDDETVVIVSKVAYYKSLVERYERDYASAKTKYQWDHLEKKWSDLQKERRELVGPIQALEKDLFEDANKLLSKDQFALGALPPEMTEMRRINLETMWGLTILGAMLIAGLFTRLAALGACGLLSMFYLAMPPWPGVQEIPGIEHNLIVNKVLIEILCLLTFAALPTGKWFGIDAIISGLLNWRKTPRV